MTVLEHIDALHEMGCAVTVITPDDAAAVFDEIMDPHEAHAWLRHYCDDVEGAILGDYWGDAMRDIYDWRPKND